MTFGIRGSASFRRRTASAGSTLWSSWAVRSTRRYGLWLKFLIVPFMIFGIADHRLHVVRCVDRRAEETDHLHRALDFAGDDVVADLERPQHENERARCEIRQQPAPRRAYRDAEARDERRERRRLDAEVAEDRDDQDDVEGDRLRIEPT